MAGVFPDVEDHIKNLQAAAVRLNLANQIGGQAQARVEELRAELAEMNRLNQDLIDERNALRAELETAQAELAAARNNATRWWFDTLRGELANEDYSQALSTKNAGSLFSILTTPILTPVKEISAARINSQLAKMRIRLKKLPPDEQEYWTDVLSTVSAYTTITIDDPLTVELLNGAEALKLITKEEREKMGKIPITPLERLGLVEVVKAPAQITQAMGW